MSHAEQQRRRKHRKERRSREQHRRLARLAGELPERTVRLYRYTITEDPLSLPDEPDDGLEAALADTRVELLDEVHHRPRSAIAKLLALLERFPDARLLLNWLTAARATAGDNDEARRLILRTYQLYPEYLFARVNYANLLLDEHKMEEADHVMEHRWDMGAMYPHRQAFHETEFLAFSRVAFRYFVVAGESEAASSLYDVMRQWDPDHPLTALMRKVLDGDTLVHFMDEFRRGRRGGNIGTLTRALGGPVIVNHQPDPNPESRA